MNGQKYRDMVHQMKEQSVRESKRLWQANDRREKAFFDSLTESEKVIYLKERGLEYANRRKDGRPKKADIKRLARKSGALHAIADGIDEAMSSSNGVDLQQ